MDINLPKLPIAFMNEDHAHAKSLWRSMQAAMADYPAQAAPLAAACHAFLEHNRAHFAREEAIMQEYAFPPYAIHKAEHDRILIRLAEIASLADAGGSVEELKAAINFEVPNWLVQHVQSMDTVTARWIASQV